MSISFSIDIESKKEIKFKEIIVQLEKNFKIRDCKLIKTIKKGKDVEIIEEKIDVKDIRELNENTEVIFWLHPKKDLGIGYLFSITKNDIGTIANDFNFRDGIPVGFKELLFLILKFTSPAEFTYYTSPSNIILQGEFNEENINKILADLEKLGGT